MHSFHDGQESRLLLIAIKPHSVIDGDTLRVEIVAPKDWQKSLGPVRQSKKGEVWIRLLGLDAPETHFPQGPGYLRYQVPEHGQYSTGCLNRALGITASLDDGEMQLFNTRTKPAPTSHSSLTHLFAEHQGMDRYGRVLAFVWKTQEQLDATTHSLRSLEANHRSKFLPIERSVNHSLLAVGAAYPDFHSSISPEGIACLRSAVNQAKQDCLGVWRADQTCSGIVLSQASDLAHKLLILPRLYRRIAAFLLSTDTQIQTETALRTGFRNYLAEIDQAIWVLSKHQSVLFSESLTWSAPQLALQFSPEDLIWQ